MNLGEKIKHARRKAKLSQAALAEKLGFAHNDPSIVCKWERNEREPKIPNLMKLAQTLGVSIGWMLNGK